MCWHFPHCFLYSFLVILLVSSWKSSLHSILLIEYLFQVTLCFNVKLINSLCIINFLWINFVVSHNEAFPNSFICFLHCYVDIFSIFQTPVGFFCFNFFIHFSITENFTGTFDFNAQVFWFYGYCKVFGFSACWDCELSWSFKSGLCPTVVFQFGTIVSTHFCHFFNSSWNRFCFNFWFGVFWLNGGFFCLISDGSCFWINYFWFLNFFNSCSSFLGFFCFLFSLFLLFLFFFLLSNFFLLMFLPSFHSSFFWWESLLMSFLVFFEITLHFLLSNCWWETHFVAWFSFIIEIGSSL